MYRSISVRQWLTGGILAACAVVAVCGLVTVSLVASRGGRAAAATSPTDAVTGGVPGQIAVACQDNLSDAGRINGAIGQSRPGDEIVIHGPCLINHVIKLLGARSYTGQSRTGTVLTQADGANLPAIMASDSYLDNTTTTGLPLSVRSLTIDGNSAHNRALTDGIIVRSWQSVLENLHIENMPGDGIRITNLSQNGTVLSDTEVNGIITDNFIEYSGRYGVYVQDESTPADSAATDRPVSSASAESTGPATPLTGPASPGNSVTDWQLTNNYIASSGSDGVYMENAAGWYVERNHIYGVGQDAIYANRIYGSSISDNYIEDFGDTTTLGTWYGIDATVQGDAVSTIADNRVFHFPAFTNTQSTFRFIGITQVNYGTGYVNVTGNAVEGLSTSLGTGLYYSQGTASGVGLTVTSSANSVIDVKTPLQTTSGVVVSPGM